jgi:hypothetical protein
MDSADRAVAEGPKEVAGGVTRTSRLSGCKGYDAAAENHTARTDGEWYGTLCSSLSGCLRDQYWEMACMSFPAHRGPNNHRVHSIFSPASPKTGLTYGGNTIESYLCHVAIVRKHR